MHAVSAFSETGLFFSDNILLKFLFPDCQLCTDMFHLNYVYTVYYIITGYKNRVLYVISIGIESILQISSAHSFSCSLLFFSLQRSPALWDTVALIVVNILLATHLLAIESHFSFIYLLWYTSVLQDTFFLLNSECVETAVMLGRGLLACQ